MPIPPGCKLHKRNVACLHLLPMACLLWALSACSMSSTRPGAEASATTFVVVRHAEKAVDDVHDPSLSLAGQARAQALARLLSDAPVCAAYVTQYRRTQQTAAPTASAHGIRLSTYAAALPAAQLAAQLRATHVQGGTVLVVGHSNTVPDIAAALSGQHTETMPESEFDRLYRIRIGIDGKTSLMIERYP